MKRTHRNAGFSLVEMATVIGIVGILAALSFAALEVLPQRMRLTGGALEFSAVLSSARSQAYGRNQRVAVLINADKAALGKSISYWVVVDPWSNLGAAMAAKNSWQELTELTPGAPAPAGSEYSLLDSGHFNPSVRLLPGGYKTAVGAVVHKGCTAKLATQVGLAQGPTVGSDTFPPPFCFVPNDRACTFCTGDGVAGPTVRGAVFFEPDGSVLFVDSAGTVSPEGSGSVTLLPTGAGGVENAQAVVITNTGLVRTFSAHTR